MITYSVCMDCQTPLGSFTATAGVSVVSFNLSHGLCERCRDKRLAEIEALRFQREGLALERERESRRLANQAEAEYIESRQPGWRGELETGASGKRLSQLLKECGI